MMCLEFEYKEYKNFKHEHTLTHTHKYFLNNKS